MTENLVSVTYKNGKSRFLVFDWIHGKIAVGLFCDRCHKSRFDGLRGVPTSSKYELAMAAMTDGWKFTDRKNLCPRCANMGISQRIKRYLKKYKEKL